MPRPGQGGSRAGEQQSAGGGWNYIYSPGVLVMILVRLSLLVSSLGLLLSSLSLLPAMMIHFKQANLGSFLPFTTTLKVNTQRSTLNS